jgi:peptidoglycan/LPS O-acetylase OafA/YrhL
MPELDGLRAIAIALVMLYHIWLYRGPSPLGRAIGRFASIGWCGVDIFLAMSGFLITGILVDSIGSPHYFKSFFIRRSLRIFPLYYAVMTLLVAAALTASAIGIPLQKLGLETIDRVWINYLYITNFAMALKGSDWVPMDIAWSLAIEEQFYLLYPFAVRWLSRGALLRLLAGAVLVAPIARYASSSLLAGGFAAAYALPFCRMDALALGGIAALALRSGDGRLRAWLSRAALPLWIAAAAILATLVRTDVAFIVVGYPFVSAATAATIVQLQLGRWRPLRAALGYPPLVAIGKISYGLYLLHLFARAAVMFGPLGGVFAGFERDLPLSALRALAVVAIAIAMAAISWFAFEKPILGLKSRLAPEPGRAAGGAAPVDGERRPIAGSGSAA